MILPRTNADCSSEMISGGTFFNRLATQLFVGRWPAALGSKRTRPKLTGWAEYTNEVGPRPRHPAASPRPGLSVRPHRPRLRRKTLGAPPPLVPFLRDPPLPARCRRPRASRPPPPPRRVNGLRPSYSIEALRF